MNAMKINPFDIENFDRFLSENSATPSTVLMHPDAWFGYFLKPRVSRIRHVVFTKLGRFFHNKKLYWIGFPIRFVDGLSIFLPGKYAEWVYLDENENHQDS